MTTPKATIVILTECPCYNDAMIRELGRASYNDGSEVIRGLLVLGKNVGLHVKVGHRERDKTIHFHPIVAQL